MPSLPNDPAIPDWAVDEARAALKMGLSVPTIEKLLISKGLSPSTATAAVNAVLGEQLPAGVASDGPGVDALMVHRVASAAVVCLCLGLAYAFGGGESVGRTFLWLMLPAACIWWAEVLSSDSPPALARWAAWVILILIGVYRVVLLTL